MGIKVGGHMNDDNQQDDIYQVPASSPDLKTELAKKLQELVPEAITDGKVDTKKLKELLDEDTADDSERFGLFWPGKKRAMRAAQEPTTATLKPAKEESKDWDTTQNIFIEGDNLEVLKILQKHYHNKIKMIYIDPPYNTGKDFVYPDNYKEGLQSYLEFTKQVNEEGKKISTNSDTDGRYHSNWLNMMYPRLKLARNLLTEDGVIFISIGDDEDPHLRKICDEIFGESNFISQVVWERAYAPVNLKRFFSESHDYILVYARNIETLGSLFLSRTSEANERYSNPDNDPRGDWKGGDFSVGPAVQSNIYEITTPSGRKILPPAGRSWRVTEEKFRDLVKDSRVWFGPEGNNVPALKRFISEVKQGMTPMSLWRYTEVGHSQDATKKLKQLFDNKMYFDYPKPVSLIKRLVELGTLGDRNEFVLDFFSGSGTTAHAVMEINAGDGGNRKHIQVQLPEPTEEKSEAYRAGYKNVADISKERIRRAGEKIKQDFAEEIAKRDQPLDVGFKVFKLADTNFSKWQTSSEIDVDTVQQRLLEMRESSDDNATQEDLLTEILVKLGLPLTVNVTQYTIGELTIWDVSDKAVVAYLDEHTKPTLDQLRLIADSDPGKIVILEDSFQGDDELKTNLSQICKSNDIELWTV